MLRFRDPFCMFRCARRLRDAARAALTTALHVAGIDDDRGGAPTGARGVPGGSEGENVAFDRGDTPVEETQVDLALAVAQIRNWIRVHLQEF